MKSPWRSPLPFELVPSSDGLSFETLAPGRTALPLAPHPGAFGVVRRHHVHEGVDLYCPEGTPVLAVEAGQVVAVEPFTGPAAGLPWWLDTWVVLVEGASGVVAYGEIDPAVAAGMSIAAGTQVGTVRRVLRHDKGRPTSMLHLELHCQGTRTCPPWELGRPQPGSLRDPTDHLLKAC